MSESPFVVLPCPSCGQMIRLPSNRGALLLTCPTCRHKWDWEGAKDTPSGDALEERADTGDIFESDFEIPPLSDGSEPETVLGGSNLEMEQSEGDGLGPSDADEILDEWGATQNLGQRLGDSLWNLEPRYAPGVTPGTDPDVDLDDDEFPSGSLAGVKKRAHAAEDSDDDVEPSGYRPRRSRRSIATRVRGALVATVLLPVRVIVQIAWLVLWVALLVGWYTYRAGRRAYRRARGITYYTGSEVVGCVHPDSARRIRTLVSIERALPSDADYGVVIAPACVCLELVISELLRHVERVHGRALAEALDRAGRTRQAELLRKWASGNLPMTMGLQVTLLAAIEKSVAENPTIALPISTRYLQLIGTGRLTATLERVRTEFRNPACHGTRTFDRTEYLVLAHMLLTRDCFQSWYRRGPAELDAGLLDLHVLEWGRADYSYFLPEW